MINMWTHKVHDSEQEEKRCKKKANKTLSYTKRQKKIRDSRTIWEGPTLRPIKKGSSA